MHVDPNEILPPGRSRETAIRRDARGRWWNGEDAITHPGLKKAFDAWIDRTDEGRYVLVNEINWAYVAVEGAPIEVLASRLTREGDRVSACTLSLSDGREEPLALRSLREGPDGALYCDVRGGKMPARFDTHAAVQLGDAMDDAETPAITIAGDRFVPPRVSDPLVSPA